MRGKSQWLRSVDGLGPGLRTGVASGTEVECRDDQRGRDGIITMSMIVSSVSSTTTERYCLSIAKCLGEVQSAQRLRFEVFNLELHEGLVDSHLTGRDEDVFDAVCEHLLVTDKSTGRVVGTYRMQSGARALWHHGYYSEQEFDFTPYAGLRAEMLELGRACVAAAHRNQSVLALLWRGVVRHARAHGLRYLIGCSSISSQDEAGALVTWEGLGTRYGAPEAWRTRPTTGFECRPGPAESLAVPKLMVAYLNAGARICGEPAIDRAFGTIDFLTVLDLQNMSPQFERKYLA